MQWSSAIREGCSNKSMWFLKQCWPPGDEGFSKPNPRRHFSASPVTPQRGLFLPRRGRWCWLDSASETSWIPLWNSSGVNARLSRCLSGILFCRMDPGCCWAFFSHLALPCCYPLLFFFSTRRGTLEEKWISLGVQPHRSTSTKFIPTCDSGTGQRSAIMHRPGGLNEDQLLSPSD